MIITTIDELRRCLPSHAIDHIEAFTGFIDNSEHEFLLQPLGQPLYDKLCEWYDAHKDAYKDADGRDVGYYNRLLLVAQRCVVFDAMGRAIDQQAVSINGAGINFASAEDYKPADRDAVSAAKQSLLKEAHSTLNRLLYTLEQWTAQCPVEADVTPETEELYEIVKFWRSSRFFYLAAQLLIPSATVLQEYLNIYDSREKFIQMLPDLHFIQEEVIAPAVGEDFCEFLVGMQVSGGTKRDATAAVSGGPKVLADDGDIPAVTRRLLHKLRKIEATLLEGRTKVVKVDKDRCIAARDEGMRLLDGWVEYCRQHQQAVLRDLDTAAGLTATAAALLTPQEQKELDPGLLADLLEAEAPFTSSPMFIAPVFAEPEARAAGTACGCTGDDCRIDTMLVTPPLL